MAITTPRQIKEKQPSEMKLVQQRRIKDLFERIYKRKDRIVERTQRGKAVLGYRVVTQFTGDKGKLDSELRSLEETALGIYETKDVTVFVIRVDQDIHVAEALNKETAESLWTAKEQSLKALMLAVYQNFPIDGPMAFNPEKSAREMELKELKEALIRKQAELEAQEPHVTA